VDLKAEYSAQSGTRSQKLKQQSQCPFNSVQVKIHEGSSTEDPAIRMFIPSTLVVRLNSKVTYWTFNRPRYLLSYLLTYLRHTAHIT